MEKNGEYGIEEYSYELTDLEYELLTLQKS